MGGIFDLLDEEAEREFREYDPPPPRRRVRYSRPYRCTCDDFDGYYEDCPVHADDYIPNR